MEGGCQNKSRTWPGFAVVPTFHPSDRCDSVLHLVARATDRFPNGPPMRTHARRCDDRNPESWPLTTTTTMFRWVFAAERAKRPRLLGVKNCTLGQILGRAKTCSCGGWPGHPKWCGSRHFYNFQCCLWLLAWVLCARQCISSSRRKR